jgi:hypothetical protein
VRGFYLSVSCRTKVRLPRAREVRVGQAHGVGHDCDLCEATLPESGGRRRLATQRRTGVCDDGQSSVRRQLAAWRPANSRRQRSQRHVPARDDGVHDSGRSPIRSCSRGKATPQCSSP